MAPRPPRGHRSGLPWTRGRRQFWREWLAAWETVQFEYELIDAGDRVVALVDQRMRGRSTGIEVELGKYARVYTFRDGSIVHWKGYMSHARPSQPWGVGVGLLPTPAAPAPTPARSSPSNRRR